MDTAIKEDEKIRYILADKETFHLYEMRAKALSDYVSGINAAKREGEENGFKNARVEIARKLKSFNLSFTQIHESTGLSIEEIEKL
ncbi:MAG: hypothetical protein LBT48_05655 [Prevotellaceae bacterium]|jgi:predicted transposase/invertase (TIGR01784 family)|nr:hypothetical protein [Prevotellaceae bacterium]